MSAKRKTTASQRVNVSTDATRWTLVSSLRPRDADKVLRSPSWPPLTTGSMRNPGSKNEQRGHSNQTHSLRVSGPQSQAVLPRTLHDILPATRVGRGTGECRMGMIVCYGYGLRGHFQRDCPNVGQRIGGDTAISHNTVPTPAAPPRGTQAPPCEV
ncbi:hypothetical protein HAX54_036028 [Datura stramonium]|uniref:CCHC-type domain-containing protein n=1 Tax=Datura stramonium TaxID=4076 RepID=A0ABS8VJI2_DATST|nr:hypothetical protein [Datura stramonium]